MEDKLEIDCERLKAKQRKPGLMSFRYNGYIFPAINLDTLYTHGPVGLYEKGLFQKTWGRRSHMYRQGKHAENSLRKKMRWLLNMDIKNESNS